MAPVAAGHTRALQAIPEEPVGGRRMGPGAEERQALVHELFGDDASTFKGRLLRTREVALLFQVSERAVTDWARKGRIPSVRTPGGHRRYPADEVRALLARVTEQGNGFSA